MIRLTAADLHTTPRVAGAGPVIKVGGRQYPLPSGSRVARVKKGNAEIAYVLEGNDHLWCFSRVGQIDIPANLKPLLIARYFKQDSLAGGHTEQDS